MKSAGDKAFRQRQLAIKNAGAENGTGAGEGLDFALRRRSSPRNRLRYESPATRPVPIQLRPVPEGLA
jgi:hypothetical protein